MRLVSEVPLFVKLTPAPLVAGVVMLYVPPRIQTVSPAAAVLTPFCRVAKGAARVPAFESAPVVATYYSAANADLAASKPMPATRQCRKRCRRTVFAWRLADFITGSFGA